MTREEIISNLLYMKHSVKEDTIEDITINEAIKALEQEPCIDAISRQAAINIVVCDILSSAIVYGRTEEGMAARKAIVDGLKRLPSVTPAEKVGRWEWNQYDSNPNIGNWHCSECRTIIPHMPENTDNTPIYKWCPMCGSRMMQEVEE